PAVIFPLGLLAAGQQRQAAEAAARAGEEQRVEADLRRLQIAMADARAGVRGLLLTGGARFGDDYDRGRAETQAAWRALAADARGSSLEGRLTELQVAVDTWQGWSADQRDDPSAGPAALPEEDDLFQRFRSAAEPLGARSAALAAGDRAEAAGLLRERLMATMFGSMLGPALL